MNRYRYLVCGIKSDNYEGAVYSFHENLESAFNRCAENADWFFNCDKKLDLEDLTFSFSDAFTKGIKCTYEKGNEIYTNHIIEIDIDLDSDYFRPGSCMLIWYHTGLDVDFEIHLSQSSFEKCQKEMRKEAKREFESYEGEDWKEAVNKISFYDTYEYQAWDIVKIE